MAPLDENDYSPGESPDQSESPNSQCKAKFRTYEASGDFPSLLNLPLGSDGQGSHDSHNDSGYSTRFGYSAGPSPSLSGKFGGNFEFVGFSVTLFTFLKMAGNLNLLIFQLL